MRDCPFSKEEKTQYYWQGENFVLSFKRLIILIGQDKQEEASSGKAGKNDLRSLSESISKKKKDLLTGVSKKFVSVKT
ncbi:MAG: hypothetical protein H0A75_03630 [Candidatus Methanofishera endochildressiae]|uniref:Uncharacterized protein n=1 Tax=Candidatus Methanofishera endochildressiae TaxID=2738884 RepID=A0A7Z0MP63_9GAMM|nr:hypothetical protein [Candidatus Methanofishera endochildressiae]